MSNILLLILFAVTLVTAGKYGPGFAPREQYDYIIVGSGNAGSVVAKRLTDDPRNFKVLVLEAGFPSQSDLGGTDFAALRFEKLPNGQYKKARPLTLWDIPSYYLQTFNNGLEVSRDGYIPESGDWGITSQYASNQGKIVGGSGCHNGNIWVRGDPGLFAAWNVTGWSYDDLLPYYKLSENATYPGAFAYPSLHNFTGPIEVSAGQVTTQESNITIQTCINAGIGAYTDINAQDTGCGFVPVNVRRGIRDSAALRYLGANLYHYNLDVLTYAQATEILFHDSQWPGAEPRARGVRWTDLLTNRTHTAVALREVILAAGPINTPKLMWFSGIGPADQLKQWNITLRVNNTNVGRHIRNAFFAPIIVEAPNSVRPNLAFVANQAILYAQTGQGYFGTPQFGTYNWYKSDPNLAYPDLGFAEGPVYPPPVNQLHSFRVINSSPKYADGFIQLLSNNSLDPPYLNQPLLTHPEDLQLLVNGFKLLRQFLQIEPAASFFGPEVTPGSSVQTDEEIGAYISGSLAAFAHFTGSCKMGNDGDPLRVVTPELKVVGVRNLRVVDTSVNAGPLRANFPHATSHAVAEKAAALIQGSAYQYDFDL